MLYAEVFRQKKKLFLHVGKRVIKQQYLKWNRLKKRDDENKKKNYPLQTRW